MSNREPCSVYTSLLNRECEYKLRSLYIILKRVIKWYGTHYFVRTKYVSSRLHAVITGSGTEFKRVSIIIVDARYCSYVSIHESRNVHAKKKKKKALQHNCGMYLLV